MEKSYLRKEKDMNKNYHTTSSVTVQALQKLMYICRVTLVSGTEIT